MFLPGWNRYLSRIVRVYVFPRPSIFEESALWADSFYKLKCPYVCTSHFLTPLNDLFAPTSWSPISKLFKFSESLGKSNGEKWSQLWKYFLIKGKKLLGQKKFFYWFFFLIYSLCLNVFLPPLPKSNVHNFFWNPWGKVMERSGLRFENFCSERV